MQFVLQKYFSAAHKSAQYYSARLVGREEHTDEENAHVFFSGPTFPQWAIDKLGYPEEGIAHGGIAAGFHMPADDRV